MGIKDIVLHSNTRWGGSRLAAAGFALALLIAPGWAQRYLAAQDGWMDSVSVVDTNAGALFDFDLITLSGTADPPPSQTYDAQVVGGEIWVSSGQYVYRYDRTSLNFLCAIGPLGPARGIEVLGDRVWVAAGESLHEFATDGSRRATYAVPNAYDVLHWNGELLVSNRVDDTIDRYSLFGKFLGVFADSDTPSGALFQPGQLARRSRNWNLLVAGGVRIFEIDPRGVFIGEYQAGALEQGVQEMADGRLLVTLINGAVIFDPTTGALTPVHGATGRSIRFLSPLDSGDGSSVRFCEAAPNSAGPGAPISALGTASVSDGPDRFALEVVGLPPDEFCLFVYGGNTSQLPFGDGFLCVGPLSPRVFQILPALRASPDGTVLQRIDYDALPPNGPITAGSTYAFQLLYRDTGFGVSGFNGSDGVQVTFQP